MFSLRLFGAILAMVLFGFFIGCDHEEGRKMMEPVMLIDVRTPAEFGEEHVEGAKLVPLDQLREEIGNVIPDKNVPVALYCRSGRRSDMAKAVMEEMGYRNVRNLGGMNDAAQMLGRKVVK